MCGRRYACTSVALWSDLIVAAFGSGHIRIFSSAKGSLLAEVTAHAKWINAIDVAPATGMVCKHNNKLMIMMIMLMLVIMMMMMLVMMIIILFCSIVSQQIANSINWAWLTSGVLEKDTEGFLTAADRTLRTNAITVKIDKQQDEVICGDSWTHIK